LFRLLAIITVCPFSKNKMERELNSAWTEAYRHRTGLVRDFELRHQCCGYNSVQDRSFPPYDPKNPVASCTEDPTYGFKVSCKPELSKDFERWQSGIQNLLIVQVTMMVGFFIFFIFGR